MNTLSMVARLGISVAVLLLLTGMVIQVLWNGVLPDLVGAQPITFPQALMLHCLVRSLLYGTQLTPNRSPQDEVKPRQS